MPDPSTCGEIWLGDVLRAADALGAHDAGQLDAIARLLGMRPPAFRIDTPADASGRGHRGVSAGRPGPAPAVPPNTPDPADAESTVNSVPLLEPQLVRGFPGQRQWTQPALAPTKPADHGERPRPAPLLPPQSEAATLRFLVSRAVPEGQVDIVRLLDMLGTATPIIELPYRQVRTLRYGVQMLVDLGEGMEPFLRDSARLIERVTAISGRHATDVRWFAGCPLDRSGPGAGWTWGPYRPPAAGTRVLVVSDFGGQLAVRGNLPARYAEDWQRTAALVRYNDCSPVALVPAPPERWPGWLTSVMPALCWDRSTTAAVARSVLS